MRYVILGFFESRNPLTDKLEEMDVLVRDLFSNEYIACGSISEIGKWLSNLNYKYVAGSNGIWGKKDA
jgi:hypothetical protein